MVNLSTVSSFAYLNKLNKGNARGMHVITKPPPSSNLIGKGKYQCLEEMTHLSHIKTCVRKIKAFEHTSPQIPSKKFFTTSSGTYMFMKG